jgi:hypothetical protein
MYDLKDLPYEPGLQDMPNTFTPYRNKVEKNCKINAPLSISKGLGSFPENTNFAVSVEKYSAELPNLEDLGYTSDQTDHANSQDPRGVMTFKGGETAALERVKDYIWDKDLLRNYFDTRNGMIGADYSTKVGILFMCLLDQTKERELTDRLSRTKIVTVVENANRAFSLWTPHSTVANLTHFLCSFRCIFLYH